MKTRMGNFVVMKLQYKIVPSNEEMAFLIILTIRLVTWNIKRLFIMFTFSLFSGVHILDIRGNLAIKIKMDTLWMLGSQKCRMKILLLIELRF